MNDMPPFMRAFSKAGKLRTHAVKMDHYVEVNGLRSSNLRNFNTTWYTLQEHGWTGSNGKCLTKAYIAGSENSIEKSNLLGLSCRAKPIDHPKLTWNGQPCTQASTESQCSQHSEICDWKPGPKCDLRFYHSIKYRCVECKRYKKRQHGSIFARKDPILWGAKSFCDQCAKFQFYYSKDKSELACHVLEHFYGLGPEITSRIEVAPHNDHDHGKSPERADEFLFDGNRTCVYANGCKVGGSRSVTCTGGHWGHDFGGVTGKRGLKNMLEFGSHTARWTKFSFWGSHGGEGFTETSITNKENHKDFYETLEALAEAVKHGGVHPECSQVVRPTVEAPVISKNMAMALQQTIEEVNQTEGRRRRRRAASKERRRRSTVVPAPTLSVPAPSPKQPCKVSLSGRTETSNCGSGAAKLSKTVCHSMYVRKDGYKQACVWMPDYPATPYKSPCIPCSEVTEAEKEISSCGPQDISKKTACPAKCVAPSHLSSRRSFTLFSPCTKFLNIWGFCGCSEKHKSTMVSKKTLDSIDCRGCNDEAVAKLRGASCATVNPGLPPAFCLSLKAFGVSDADIAKISQRSHWAHGAEYFYGEKATCIAAGDPANTCSRGCDGQCNLESKIPAAKTCSLNRNMCPMALWCSGGTYFPALGMTVEQSKAWHPGTLGYGSWAAQAEEVARAVTNGGEHPNCPAATVRAGGQDPCIDITVGKVPNVAFKRICDSDCKGLPYRLGGPPSGVPCGLRFRYPALYAGPDTVPGGAAIGQYYGSAPIRFITKHVNQYFWRCKFAGYGDKLGKPQYGMDDEDEGYFSRDQNLFHTKTFGKDICSEWRGDFCAGQFAGFDVLSELRKRHARNILKLPGCRSDLAPGSSCGDRLGSFRGSGCICEQHGKDPEEPNSMKLNNAHIPAFGVDTCGSKTERQQPAFECFGPLMHLEPGESMRYGFRCKKDEEGLPPFVNPKLPSQKLWCPKGAMTIPDMCKSSTWNYKMPLPFVGRFSPGKGPVKACVRLGVVCNGECNCKDCSDEADCKNRPLVVGSAYDRIGWSTPQSKLRCRRAGDPSPKDLPDNILRCEKEGIVL